MTRSKSFIRPVFAAALVAAFFAVAPYQAAQAQRTSLTDIDLKLDGVQDTLGPVPGPSEPDIQQQIDELRRLILQLSQKTVFATSTRMRGDFGGLLTGDAVCNNLARTAGLPGVYMAWLSDGTDSPSTRFNKAPFPYVRVDGTRVASGYADLTDGQLLAPINVDENGNTLGAAGGGAWTGTVFDGTSGPIHCSAWTSTSGGGGLGIISSTDQGWTGTGFGGDGCGPSHDGWRLYCFQQ